MQVRITVLLILGFHAGLAIAQDYQIDVSLFRGDPTGSREAGTLTRVAAPTLAPRSGQEASLRVGSEVLIGGQFVSVGQLVQIVATDAGNGAIRVKLSLENSKVVGKKAVQVVSTRTQTTTTVQSGSKIRLKLGDNPKNMRWVEVTISKVK